MPERSLELLQCYCRLGRLCYQQKKELTPPMAELVERIDLLLSGKAGMGRWFASPEELTVQPEELMKLLPLEDLPPEEEDDGGDAADAREPEAPKPSQWSRQNEPEPEQAVSSPQQGEGETPPVQDTPQQTPSEPAEEEQGQAEQPVEPSAPEPSAPQPPTPEPPAPEPAPPAPEPVPEKMQCPHCGKLLTHPGKYCIYCCQPLFDTK